MSPPLFLFRDDSLLKAHPAYQAAKAGDAEAAVRLVVDLAGPLADEARAAFGPAVIYVAPHAFEASGENAIPQTLARAMANATGCQADTEIVQANRVYHTGANRMERLNSRAEFAGPVQRDRQYVVVDDVTTMGGTLAELADYIQAGGGLVKGAVVIVNASRSDLLGSDPRIVAEIERRHGDAIVRSFELPRPLSRDQSRDISLGSVRLTKSEIEALRQGKKRIDAYAQRALTGWATKPVS